MPKPSPRVRLAVVASALALAAPGGALAGGSVPVTPAPQAESDGSFVDGIANELVAGTFAVVAAVAGALIARRRSAGSRAS